MHVGDTASSSILDMFAALSSSDVNQVRRIVNRSSR